MQIYCQVCLNVHLAELKTNISALKSQLTDIESKLLHKNDDFSCRLYQLTDIVLSSIEDKIKELKKRQEDLTADLKQIQWENDERCRTLHRNILELKNDLDQECQVILN